ncbi:helix-turn-helix domain-containing protein [Paraburkholderia acidisoli]|uniref:Helix-turn-helix domain-containing protein n=1 Tax=Paraburkholderia acidisoli TaxID=2571748 RepID=A0A7Z2GM77_9BURK|nr:helix-turn-helix transcriptional regulator [Paraburkholderia acidisoli]QGZ64258.1 helix-turn-helix domain-containing protein [Paraburkholderia acidisoli]
MVEANPASRNTRLATGELLRYWRGVRGQTQLGLSLASGVSQRHISFIESGRSSPSRQMLLDLAESLDIPLRDRNGLLLTAGYAPIYAEGTWEDEAMLGVTTALKRMLHHAEPYPAVVMDRYWNVLMTNEGLPRLFNCFTDVSSWPGPNNILHAIFDPARLRPHISGWNNLAISLIQRVYREAVGRHVDEQTTALLESLLAYPGVPGDWKTPKGLESAVTSPVVPLALMKDGQTLRFFSMVTTVGTPQTVAGQELRLECMLPVDAETERLHQALLDEALVRNRS